MVDNYLPVFDMAEQMGMDKHVEEQLSAAVQAVSRRERGIPEAPGELLLFLHPLVQDASRQVVRCGMAAAAYRCHILRVIGSPLATVQDMVHMQLPAFLFTDLAGIPVTVQDIGTDIFIVVLRSFLVQVPMDFRIFHAGRIETSQLDGKTVPFREKSLQLFDPPDMVVCL